MGWRGTMRSVGAAIRAAERESQRRQRELERYNKQMAKVAQLQEAASAVEEYDSYVNALVSLHKQASDPVYWRAMLDAPEPVKPVPVGVEEAKAQRILKEYQPGFFDRLFRRAERVRAALQDEVDNAIARDRHRNEQALAAYDEAHKKWRDDKALAARVLNGEPQALRQAVKELELFKDIAGLGSRVAIDFHDSGVIDATLHIHGEDIIPDERSSLLQSGKLSVKRMPKGEYYELYQDHVCSCALRIARELFAALPVDHVLVTAVDELLNPATGHLEEQPILSAAIPRATLAKLNLQGIDPSEAMKNFVHNMDFKKTKGLAPVARVKGLDVA